jgi:hypothetical protein
MIESYVNLVRLKSGKRAPAMTRFDEPAQAESAAMRPSAAALVVVAVRGRLSNANSVAEPRGRHAAGAAWITGLGQLFRNCHR